MDARLQHEPGCPQRADFEQKLAKSSFVYNNYKHDFKRQQKERADLLKTQYGHTNQPADQNLPHLKYKYKMNEPFLGGE